MASKSMVVVMGLLLVLVFLMGNAAQAQTSCGNTLIGLAPCISYVTGNSPAPSPACCSQLGVVVQSAPECLCALMNASGSNPMGININQTLALALPAICKVPTPPVSQCNTLANGPASSPAGQPSPAPAASPASPTADATNPNPQSPAPATTKPTISPGGATSKTVSTSTSGAEIMKPALFIFLAAVVSAFANF